MSVEEGQHDELNEPAILDPTKSKGTSKNKAKILLKLQQLNGKRVKANVPTVCKKWSWSSSQQINLYNP